MGLENKGGGWGEIKPGKQREAVLDHQEAVVTSLSRYLKKSIFIFSLSYLLAHPVNPSPNFSFQSPVFVLFVPVTLLL